MIDILKNQRLGSQISFAGSNLNNENILSDYNIALIDYEKAYFNDVLAKVTIDMLIAPIRQAGYQIILKNDYSIIQQKAKKIIELTINGLIDGFEYVKNHCLFSIVTGSQFFEIVYNVEKYENIFLNRIIRLLPVKNENIINYLFDKHGDFAGLEVLTTSFEKKELKKNDIFYIIHNQYFNDPRGISELRNVINLIRLKQELLKHSERTIARGVGIPIAYATENFDTLNLDTYKNILRKIANTDGAYALINKQEVEKIEFLTVDQSNIMPLLEYLNRDIFFNTLTQFLTTGLGQNGARATAEELKSPYLLKMKTIVTEIESAFQWLCNIIIENSSISIAIKKEDYPIFKLTGVTDIDVPVLASTIATLANIGLQLNDKDINYIRDLLKLPNQVKNIETEGAEQLTKKRLKSSNKSIVKKQTPKREHKKLRQPKIVDFKIFEMEAIENLYNEVDIEVEKVINEIIKQIAIDIYISKKINQEIDFSIIYEKLINAVSKIKNNIYTKSKEIALKEIKKLNRKMLSSPKSDANVDAYMEFIISIVDAVKGNDFTGDLSYIDIEDIIKKSIKKETSLLKQEAKKEVQNARGDVFENSDVKKFKYIATLDNNVCSVCEPLHDAIFDVDEIKIYGLNLKSPVNPNCLGSLGGNVCRCQLVPIE